MSTWTWKLDRGGQLGHTLCAGSKTEVPCSSWLPLPPRIRGRSHLLLEIHEILNVNPHVIFLLLLPSSSLLRSLKATSAPPLTLLPSRVLFTLSLILEMVINFKLMIFSSQKARLSTTLTIRKQNISRTTGKSSILLRIFDICLYPPDRQTEMNTKRRV